MSHRYKFHYHSQYMDQTFSYDIDTIFIYIHMFKSYDFFNLFFNEKLFDQV